MFRFKLITIFYYEQENSMSHCLYPFRYIYITLLLFLLAACDLKPELPLTLGTNVWPGYETFYLARSLGIYQKDTVKLVELPSATEVSHAFNHGLIDVAALTLDEVLVLAQHQTDIRVILVLDVSHGGDVLLARPDIYQLKDIKGKRVAVENTAVGAILLDGALTAANLSVADIDIIPVGVDEHLEAYTHKKIDAVVTFEPVKTQLQKIGAKLLFDSSKIPNRIVDVLVTRQAVIEQHPAQLKQLLSGYFEALEYFYQYPDDATVRMSPRLMVNPPEANTQFEGLVLSSLDDNIKLLSGTKPQLTLSIVNLVELMLKQKLLAKKVDAKYLIYGGFLPAKGKQ